MSNAVELCQVTKTFGTHVAVDNLDLTVPVGTVYGFIGPNGSGKTTTLRMILRILHPDRGRIQVLGQERLSSADDRVAYLPEERGLYKKMKVRDIIRFYAHLKGLRDCRAQIDSWLERLDLVPWADKRVETLSKGMSQKVQFIATIISRPQLVVLDEPFSGLDPVNMEVLKDAVVSLRAQGSTVIFSTHDMDVAERRGDTILMIFRGQKVLDGTLESIQTRYGSDTIRVRVSGLRGNVQGIGGVQRVNDYGPYKELRVTPDGDPQRILRELIGMGNVEHFELSRPSLHDIFVRIAGPEAAATQEPAHA
jgi:ABC-2 type transport system ATP-binding protein